VSALEKRLGVLRPTQLIHSFGIGAIIDLPHFAVMSLGLDDWPEGYCSTIAEDRLLRAVKARLGPQVEKLVGPPFENVEGLKAAPGDGLVGIPVVPFPRYMRCPYCQLLGPLDRFKLRTHVGRPDRAAYVHQFCNTHCLARFVTGRGPLPHQPCYPPRHAARANAGEAHGQGSTTRIGSRRPRAVPRRAARRQATHLG
jgi:hypothetical protein